MLSLLTLCCALCYICGGCGANNQFQIYNTTSNTWRFKRMPWWAGGSMVAVAVGRLIFFCGGITNDDTVSYCAKIDWATDRMWAMASMPKGVNHPGYGTDGRRIFVFGGR